MFPNDAILENETYKMGSSVDAIVGKTEKDLLQLVFFNFYNSQALSDKHFDDGIYTLGRVLSN